VLNNAPIRGFFIIRRKGNLVKVMTNLEQPEYAVPGPNLIPVSGHLATMTDIPPSRMFTIKEALKKYQQKAEANAAVYDASQGDGGASLPGVPQYILETAWHWLR
jgi:hypothetical protein